MSVAAHKGREKIVKMLISADADVNIDSNNGSTPLIQASHFGKSAGRALPTIAFIISSCIAGLMSCPCPVPRESAPSMHLVTFLGSIVGQGMPKW